MGRVRVSSRASWIAKPNDSPYYIGLDRVLEDPYDRVDNPNGVIQLGLSENRVRVLVACVFLVVILIYPFRIKFYVNFVSFLFFVFFFLYVCVVVAVFGFD